MEIHDQRVYELCFKHRHVHCAPQRLCSRSLLISLVVGVLHIVVGAILKNSHTAGPG
jgi:hypothetical protein